MLTIGIRKEEKSQIKWADWREQDSSTEKFADLELEEKG